MGKPCVVESGLFLWNGSATKPSCVYRPYSCGAANADSDPVRRLHRESGDVAVWAVPRASSIHGVAPAQGRAAPVR